MYNNNINILIFILQIYNINNMNINLGQIQEIGYTDDSKI